MQVDNISLFSAATPESATVAFCCLSGIPLYFTYDPLKSNVVAVKHWIFECSDFTFKKEFNAVANGNIKKAFAKNPDGIKLLAYAALYRLGTIRVLKSPIDWRSLSLDLCFDIFVTVKLYHENMNLFVGKKAAPKINAYNSMIDFSALVQLLQTHFSQTTKKEFYNELSEKTYTGNILTVRSKESAERIEYEEQFWDILELEISSLAGVEDIFPKEEREHFGKILSMPLHKAALYTKSIHKYVEAIISLGATKKENGEPNLHSMIVLKQASRINQYEKENFKAMHGSDMVQQNSVKLSEGIFLRMDSYAYDKSETPVIPTVEKTVESPKQSSLGLKKLLGK